MNGVTANAQAFHTAMDRDGLGHRANAAFRRRVGEIRTQPDERGGGGHIDDGPATALLHQFDSGLAPPKRCIEVDAQHAPPDFGRCIFDVGDRRNAGVIHQSIQSAVAFFNLRHQVTPGGFLTDILLDEGGAKIGRVGLSGLGVDVGHDDVRTFSRQYRRVRKPQPRGCAGDHDDLAFHSIHILIRYLFIHCL